MRATNNGGGGGSPSYTAADEQCIIISNHSIYAVGMAIVKVFWLTWKLA
jgi:hypothetical protein